MADTKTEKQKVQEITEKLEQGIKELFESEKYKNYLNTMSKFHNYSFNNTILIAMQKPDATLVAGFQAWKKNFERHVKKGEKGIRILAPAPYKVKEEQEKLDPETKEIMLDKDGKPVMEEVEITIPAFRAVSVFDVSQTDGRELPELAVSELSADVEDYQDFMKALEMVSPVPIGYEDISGEAKGYYHTEGQRVAIQLGMGESQTVKTAIHEVAHAKLHSRELNRDAELSEQKDRNTKEVEAESVAYTVCQHFGIDTSEYSFGYIAGWSSGKEMTELKSSLDTIRRTASEMISGIEAHLQELQKDRVVEQDIVDIQENSEMSIMKQAEELINRLETNKTIFSSDERNLIVNYAYKIGDMEKTEELAYRLAELEENSPNLVAQTVSNAQAEIDALPDGMVGLSEMHEYGYTWAEMLPLTQERAEELFKEDVAVYQLHKDGSETMIEDMEDLQAHKGMFGVEKEDWNAYLEHQTMKNELEESSANKESLLLHGSENQFGIYQLKDTPEARDIHFMNMDYLESRGIAVNKENYDLVYTAPLEDGTSLEDIYTKFNIDHPEDFKDHSLSVSDVVVLHQNGENTSHYVDSFGYKEVLEFTQEVSKEKSSIQKSQDIQNETVKGYRDMTPEEVKDFVKQRFVEQLHNSGIENISMYMEKFDILYEQGKMDNLMPIEEEKCTIEDVTFTKNDNLDIEEKEPEQIVEQKPTIVTLMVSECSEFHNLGEFHEGIETVDEAIKLYHQIPPERMSAVRGIGINIHKEGTESYEDVEIDIISGKVADLEILDYVPDITDDPKAIEIIAELIDKLPDIEVRGSLEKWQAASLATQIDQLSYDYDTYQYRDTVENREVQVANITEDIRNGNTGYLNDFLNAIIAESVREGITDILGQGSEIDDSEAVQTARRAKELLDKLAEYKPLAKVEELEENNYNMIDNVLNNEKPKKEEERSSGRISIKEKLAEKKAMIEHHDKGEKLLPVKESEKKLHREI